MAKLMSDKRERRKCDAQDAVLAALDAKTQEAASAAQKHADAEAAFAAAQVRTTACLCTTRSAFQVSAHAASWQITPRHRATPSIATAAEPRVPSPRLMRMPTLPISALAATQGKARGGFGYVCIIYAHAAKLSPFSALVAA